MEIDHIKGAIDDYDMAIRLNPEFANPCCNSPNAKNNLDDTKGAIEYYDTTIQLNPEHSYAYYNRGMVREALGQHEAAEADFAKAKEIDLTLKK